MTSDIHEVYLNLGSNIQPEANLVKAIQLLQEYGNVQKVSSAWESKSVGMDGPNYLNSCILLATDYEQASLKERVIRPIETQLGRKRSENKYTPRTIDIDTILFDEERCNQRLWEFVFIIVPLAEIYPLYQDPITNEFITQTAARLRSEVWIKRRPEVLSQLSWNRFKGQN
ncbi:MAG TPA: 2-amino-4-hydroxy-6-hydroxymethyldihydropteridine diphosphokinase [Anaerolineales bacterium]|nr:2-amino-4-hydroxy-6-hydroxymethyldihydropteridine diphosphokinase [Anaerolineales bacterium]